MAGYGLCSLDADKFLKFVANPTNEQLLQLAEIASEHIDEFDDEDYEEDSQVLTQWPVDPEELVPILRERLAGDDWYAGLADHEKDAFEYIIGSFLMEEGHGVGYEPERELDAFVYWDVIRIIRKFHDIPSDKVTDKIISRFGMTPYRGMPDQSKVLGLETWAPMHSLHLPEDVKKLREEVLAAEEAVMNSDDENAKQEYEDVLVPMLDRLVASGRILLVEVDT